MKILLLSGFLLIASVPGCQDNVVIVEEDPGTDLSPLTGVVWWMLRQASWGDTLHIGPHDIQHTFYFHRSGRFTENYPGGCCQYEGFWYLHAGRDDTTMRLAELRTLREYKVKSLTSEELILVWQGKGPVYETYGRNRPTQ